MRRLIANLNGVQYQVAIADYSDTSGPTSPGLINQWTVFRDQYDNFGHGVLIDLGKKFGYRLTMRGNDGRVTSQEFTTDQVTITEV